MRSSWFLLGVPAGALAMVLVSAFGGCGNDAFLGAGASGGGTITTSISSTSGAGGFSSGSGGNTVGNLGAPCTLDAGCGGDLLCDDPSTTDPIFGGGPPGGFCTKACLADADCTMLGGVCYGVDGTLSGRCTLPCTIGVALDAGLESLFSANGALRPAKCHGRSDLRCAKTTANGAGVCLPTCGEDAQCGARFCDPRSAVCVDKPNMGLPTGAACDPAASPSPCAGMCVLFQTGVAMCSDPCVLGCVPPSPDAGQLEPTPLPGDCGGLENGLCAFHPVTNGIGDTGYCTPACTTQSQCQTPSFWCFSVPELGQVNRGYCFAARPCPNGQSDCEPPLDGGTDGGGDAGDAGDGGAPGDAGDAGDGSASDAGSADAGPADAGDAGDGGTGVSYTCTPTPVGAFCLDPTFPLGAISDGGASDASDAGDSGPSDAGPG